MVTAKCIKERNPWGDIPTTLTLGKEYEVKYIEMSSAITFVFIKEQKGVFNSLCFEFYEDGKPLDIFSDIRFNPYLTH